MKGKVIFADDFNNVQLSEGLWEEPARGLGRRGPGAKGKGRGGVEGFKKAGDRVRGSGYEGGEEGCEGDEE